jgi:precorrin-4/cobalt-precorrin-4 C11-methyltransferase
VKVYFVGAGPGAPDLLTLRGAELIGRCPVVLYAGSLVPRAVVARARPDARVVDTAGLTLDEVIDEMARAHAQGEDVARVHTGDPSIFGAIAEQLRRLDTLGIAREIVPGVSSFTAAAAALGVELTVPGVSQTVILARVAGRTSVPEGQELAGLAAHRATLALFLSAELLDQAVAALAPAYGADCPAAIIHRASWPDQEVVRGRVGDLAAMARAHGIDATAMVLVGPALAPEGFPDSRLYAPDFGHRFRSATKDRAP